MKNNYVLILIVGIFLFASIYGCSKDSNLVVGEPFSVKPKTCGGADVNLDGVVDGGDLTVFNESYGIKDCLNIFKRITEVSRKIERLYYKFNVKDFLSLYRERKDLVKNINHAFQKKKNPETIFLHYMLNVVQFYIDMGNFILTMNM